jgi:F420-0:gamma-glutamyl ligase
VDHVLLTLAYGLLLANAGIDQSNAGGPGKICKFPADLWGTVRQFRKDLEERTGITPLGAILTDSRVQPLKVGIIGNALSVSGFDPIIDIRGHPDLFGRPLQIKKIAIADELTSAAEVMMGEADEATPFVVIHDAPVQFVSDEEDAQIPTDIMFMPPELCLFMNVFRNYKKEPILL